MRASALRSSLVCSHKARTAGGTLLKMWILGGILMPMGATDSLEFLIDKLKGTKSNADFFDSMNQ